MVTDVQWAMPSTPRSGPRQQPNALGRVSSSEHELIFLDGAVGGHWALHIRDQLDGADIALEGA